MTVHLFQRVLASSHSIVITADSLQESINEKFIPRDTVVQENGEVMPEIDESRIQYAMDFYDFKHNRPLRLKKKLYEFYTAPITKFWANSIAYIIFLIIFSYTVLVKMESTPSWAEYIAISYIVALGCEKVREIISSEPVVISHKFAVWSWNMWNPCDAAAIIFFVIGLSLRLRPSTMDVGRVMYCVNSIYWYLRILNILGVNKYLGPLVTMMGKMVKNMIYFVVLLLVVLMSFGVCRQAILNPDEDPSWDSVKNVFYEPYFMLYGEVFADSIDPPCGEGVGQTPCHTGRWITPAVMSTYLLVANILMINLLIAVFNNIFNEVNSVSHQVWMFQRFTVVMEYEQKPFLPPPFIVFCHIHLLVKYFRRKMKGERESYDNGLKLFLEKEDLERLYDFEEECVEGYFSEKEHKLQQSSDERIKITTERIENILQKIDDITMKENNQFATMQNLDFRLRKVEEGEEQILNQLAVVQQFMSAYIGDEIPEPRTEERTRKVSERSEITSDNESYVSTQLLRRNPTLDETEEDEDKLDTTVVVQPPQAPKRVNLLTERQRSSESRTSGTESDMSSEEITQMCFDVVRMRPGLYRRDSSGRRSSEGGDSERGSTVHHGMPRRQLSQTHSEPDNCDPCCHTYHGERSVTFAEPRITVIPPAGASSQTNPRAILMAMHTEYTSIKDELESVCGLLSPPRTPRLLSPPRPGQIPPRKRNASEWSNPEMALYIEKENLRDAEENDYMLMKNLIKRHCEDDDDFPHEHSSTLLNVVHEIREFRSSPRALRRSSAIEGDLPTPVPGGEMVYPSCSQTGDMLSVPGISVEKVRQDSGDSAQTDSSHDDTTLLVPEHLPQRPSIVIDSSQLPTLQRELPKADSKASLHMQSETMC